LSFWWDPIRVFGVRKQEKIALVESAILLRFWRILRAFWVVIVVFLW
jgi:hypothetical protein